jgi:hypothetical protein
MGDNKMNGIKIKVLNNEWAALVENCAIKDVCAALTFKEVMHVVQHLFYDDIQDDEKQQYALNLAFEVKDHFNKEWDSDWKNDVFLGGLCVMLWRYDERYFYYKRAYDKLEDPPMELLLLLADCNTAPGVPPITDAESEYYLKKAIEKKVTSESALTMRSFYKCKGDRVREMYWDRMHERLEAANIHSNQIIPDVLK